VVLAPFVDFGRVDTDEGAWTYLIIIGVVHTGLMSTLLYSAIQKIPTALVGALSFIYPVVAILVDWVAFAIRSSALQVLGASAILLAGGGHEFWMVAGPCPASGSELGPGVTPRASDN